MVTFNALARNGIPWSDTALTLRFRRSSTIISQPSSSPPNETGELRLEFFDLFRDSDGLFELGDGWCGHVGGITESNGGSSTS